MATQENLDAAIATLTTAVDEIVKALSAAGHSPDFSAEITQLKAATDEIGAVLSTAAPGPVAVSTFAVPLDKDGNPVAPVDKAGNPRSPTSPPGQGPDQPK